MTELRHKTNGQGKPAKGEFSDDYFPKSNIALYPETSLSNLSPDKNNFSIGPLLLLERIRLVTLIVGTMCEKYAIQVSDRRLSSKGLVVNDESDKSTILICENARFIVGFTGLARFGKFDTHSWLLETLRDAGPTEFTALELTQRFTARATAYFSESTLLQKVPARDRRVTIMFNGFISHPGAVMPAALLVTNYQEWGKGDASEAWPEFRNTYFGLKENWEPPLTWVQRIGARQAFREDHSAVKQLLYQGRPPEAVVDKTIELIREASDRREAAGGIGKQLSSVVLPADMSKPPLVGYHSAVPSHAVYFPSLVVTTRLKQAIVRDAQFRAADPLTRPIVVPKGPRNQPCPCGSGKKYKSCHGRT